jgi:hypothetical protein
LQFSTRSLKEIGESAANFVFREGSVERSAETIRDDPDGEYLKIADAVDYCHRPLAV